MDTITPDDLQMFRKALERFELTKQQAQQAQQAFGQAQQQHIAAAGWLEGAVETIRTRPGFPEGGSFHPETGAIVVQGQAGPERAKERLQVVENGSAPQVIGAISGGPVRRRKGA